MTATGIETSLQTHAILAWQDRWIVAFDEAFLDGWPLLDAALSDEIAKLGLLDLLGVGASIDGRVASRITAWKRVAVDPHLRAASAELAALAPAAVGLPVEAAVLDLGGQASFALGRGWITTWGAVAVVLFVVTFAATAAFTVVPFLAVLSTLLGFGFGAWTFGMYPGPRLRAGAVIEWRERVQGSILGPVSLRERTLRDTVAAASALLPAGE